MCVFEDEDEEKGVGVGVAVVLGCGYRGMIGQDRRQEDPTENVEDKSRGKRQMQTGVEWSQL